MRDSIPEHERWEPQMGGRVKVKHYKFSKLRLFNAAGNLSSPSLPRSSTFPELRLTFPSVLWSPSSHLPQNTRRQRDADQFLCIPPSAWLLISEEKRLLCREGGGRSVEWGGSTCRTTFSVSSFCGGDLWPRRLLPHHLVECEATISRTNRWALWSWWVAQVARGLELLSKMDQKHE